MPYFEPSRPSRDSFMPPNGATSVEMMPSLMPTMPYSSASATRQIAADVAAVEIGGEAELGVVGHADRLLLGLEAEQRRHRAEGLLARHHHVGRDVGQHRRLEEAAAERVTLAAGDDLGALRQRVGDVLLDLLDRLHVDQRALMTTPASMPLPTFIASTASASFAAKAS